MNTRSLHARLEKAEQVQGQFEAYLYDCDGTLADSMQPHKEAWAEEIQKHAPQVTSKVVFDLIDETAGMPGFKAIEILNQRMGLTLNAHQVAVDKENNFHSNFLHRVGPIEFVVEHLKARAAEGKKIAVVSGGRKIGVHAMLENLGIRKLVQALVCADDVKHGKPHPEPFLMAAELLKVPPSKCLVLEDAEMGVKSAIAAGMKWVRIDRI